MQTILAQFHAAFAAAIKDAFDFDADPAIGLSQNAQFGDYQSNAAMGLAKLVTEKTGQKTNPRQVAEQIRAKLQLGEIATETNIAGPGFINVKLSPTWLSAQVNTIAGDPQFAVPKVSKPQTVVVDYSGVNIAKEMHVGHLRSTIIGDAIANVLERLGHNVIRRNHLGDWGTQFGMLINELLTRFDDLLGKLRAIRESGGSEFKWKGLSDLEEFYRSSKRNFDENPEFQNESRQTVVRLQAGDPDTLEAWKIIVAETRLHYLTVYLTLGVKLNATHEKGESFYNQFLADVVDELKSKGIAIKSDGAVAVFVDGPEKSPLIIQKSDGGYLYGTTDLAAIRYRINEEHADRIIYTHDSRQAQHFSQVFRTADKAGWTHDGQVKLEYAPFGTMLGEDGKPFKTRSGDVVKLKELLDEAEERAAAVVREKNPNLPEEQRKEIAHAVGIGSVKYADLSKDRTSDYVFNWDKMLSFEGNTAPYLQYVYARIQSIFRKSRLAPSPGTPGEGGDEDSSARSENVSGLRDRTLTLPSPGVPGEGKINLESPHELALAKHILRLGEVIELVAKELKPHLLCTYLYELASKFSGFYENCPVNQSEEPVKSSRLALCDVTAKTMAIGLDLLGIEHPDQM